MNHIRNRAIQIFTFAFLTIGCMTATSWGASYYVDAVNGNDLFGGSEASPWRTTAKVNSAALQPGDAVFFKSGQVFGALTPASGAMGNPVTYAAYGTGAKPVIATCTASNKSHITLKGLHFMSTTSSYPLYLNSSSYVSIENSDIFAEASSTAYAAVRIYMNSHHNRLVGCTVAHRNLVAQNDAVNLKHNANNNLIEGNNIGTATHYALTLEGSSAAYPDYVCTNNVVRNNRITNPAGAMVEAQSNSHRNLFEGNIITGGKTTPNCANQPHSFKSVSMYNIIRNNIIHDNTQTAGGGLASYAYKYNSDPANNAVGNRVYNNLITALNNLPIVLDNYEPGVSSVKGNVYKNNIVANNGNGVQVVVGTTAGVSDNHFHNNIIFNAATPNVLKVGGSATTVAGAQATDPTHYSGNIQADPLLSGFVPQNGSPVIEEGDHLTTVTSASASGSVITVNDAAYFCDGFGVSAGDRIIVGGVATTVTAVDYATNTLTLADVITWTTGTPVSLPYSGARPSIGPGTV